MGGAPEYASGSGNVKGGYGLQSRPARGYLDRRERGRSLAGGMPGPTWTRGRFGLNITNLSLTPDTVAANSDP